MPTTPNDKFEYPTKASATWYKKGEVIDVEGLDVEQEFDGMVDWLEQIEVSLTGQVETVGDLPPPDPDAENKRTGDRRVYLVLDEGSLYRDDGTEWTEAITSSVTVEDGGTEIGDVTRFNFRTGLDAAMSSGGSEVAIDIGDKLSPNAIDVEFEFTAPIYPDLAGANASVSEGPGDLVFITGGGTDAAGLYYHDGSGWNILSSGSSGATSLSELAINSNKDWGGYSITSAGTLEGETVTATKAMNVPVYSGGDPDTGNFWLRSDR